MKNKKAFYFMGIIVVVVYIIFSYDGGEVLEEKDYVTALEFDKGKVTFEAPVLSKDEAQQILDKEQRVQSVELSHYKDFIKIYSEKNANDIDLEHLKMIIIGKEVLNDEKEMQIFLKFLKDQKEFAENIYVVVDGSDNGLLEGKEKSVGNYLEGLISKRTKKQPDKAVTLGKLLSVHYNRNQTIFIPVVADSLNIIGEWAFSPDGALGFVDGDTAMWYMTGNCVNCDREINFDEVYSEDLEEKQNFSLEINKITREISFREGNGKIYADILIKIDGKGKDFTGEALNESIDSFDKEQLLTLCLTEKMQSLADASKGKDLFNTYYELSNKNRSLWKKYKNSYKDYVDDLKINITVLADYQN